VSRPGGAASITAAVGKPTAGFPDESRRRGSAVIPAVITPTVVSAAPAPSVTGMVTTAAEADEPTVVEANPPDGTSATVNGVVPTGRVAVTRDSDMVTATRSIFPLTTSVSSALGGLIGIGRAPSLRVVLV
jgi:hypothetical protein